MTMGCDAQFAASLAETLDHSVDNMPMFGGPKPPPPPRDDSQVATANTDPKQPNVKETTDKKARGAAPGS